MATQAQDDRTATRELPSGWYAFAGALLVIVGSLNLLQGLIALLKDDYFAVTKGGLLFADFSAWGAFFLIIGHHRAPRRARDLRAEDVGARRRRPPPHAEHDRAVRVHRGIPDLDARRDHHQHHRDLRAHAPARGLRAAPGLHRIAGSRKEPHGNDRTPQSHTEPARASCSCAGSPSPPRSPSRRGS